MSFNKETFDLMLTFGLAMMGVLMVIWLLAFATPHIAKFTDKLLGRKTEHSGTGAAPVPERVEGELKGSSQAEREYKVYDIYEGTPSEIYEGTPSEASEEIPSETNENSDKKD